MYFYNKYLKIEVSENSYIAQMQNSRPKWFSSGLKTMKAIEKILFNRLEANGTSPLAFHSKQELKEASEYILTKYRQDKENAIFLRKWLMAITEFFDSFSMNFTYEEQLRMRNAHIQRL